MLNRKKSLKRLVFFDFACVKSQQTKIKNHPLKTVEYACKNE